MRAIDFEVVIPAEFYTFMRDTSRVILGRVVSPLAENGTKQSYDRFLEGIEAAGQANYTFTVAFSDLHFFLVFLRHLLRRSRLPRGFHTWLMTMHDGAQAHRETNIIDFIGEIE